MKLDTLIRQLPRRSAPLPCVDGGVEVTGVTHDSRAVRPGFVFVAIRGQRDDGHAHAPAAAAKGAVAIIAESPIPLPTPVPVIQVANARRALAAIAATFHGHPSRKLQVTGVTGTNGKTTTCHLIRSIYNASGRKAGILGTIACDTGVRRLPAGMTTPESTDIQALFAEMVANAVPAAVMEVSSHALVQRRVDFIHFHTAVFTQLTRDHLDFHKTMENYRNAKAILFESLGPASTAVLNADDSYSSYFAEHTCAHTLWYGLQRPADVRARVLDAGLNGIHFELITPAGSAQVRSPLAGLHNVANCLAAAAAGLAASIPLDLIVQGLNNAPVVDGRLHPVECGQPFTVLVDYAHTHDALRTVLKAVRRHVKGRVLLVFGAGGDRDKLKRPLMGKVAARMADAAWVTSDNPRSEDPLDIISQILRGAGESHKIHTQPDREQAIREAISAARPGDLVLIAGKGHETVQIFSDHTVPFDDREVARRCLGDLKSN
ncbi:MAG TPA: UDP-N-acetylmuramoyl-L-alanyl-D-glutamate--2,6-diaminopimelate ligase [Candidatus Brocadiia bacterium]|nr:UDP-N-acetylmuramoyl-L-alanyl-D-glutamate--2,6-diaminopimelate ligase [Candidatus Brocadiia bacterium]